MRIASFNVNSIRSRIDRVEAVLRRHDIDVLTIQETKARDDQWPSLGLEAMGYEVATFGSNQWNGVAIASRVGLSDVRRGFDGQPHWGTPLASEARALGARCNGVHVWSLYVPNGRALGDPHLAYKLEWLERLRMAAAGWLADEPDAQVALTGDWNIAPRDEDVWDMRVFARSTHVSPPERAAFEAIVQSGYADLVRPYAPGPGVYTYWDYVRLRFPKNKGMRIDFILGSPALQRRVTGAMIDREERKGARASDHAPVIVDLSSGSKLSTT
ncbi:MAG TPA: exodeoxyribonuclease III [Nocardioidaceae bacterium]